MKKALPTLLALLLFVLLVWLLLYWQPDRVIPMSSPPRGGDFTLNSLAGPVTLQDFQDRVVLIYFGYTFCPDVCPTNLGFIAAALEQLRPNELKKVQGLFISVDPERDTLEKLADYAGYFHPGIMGATASPETLVEVAGRYGAVYRKVDHATADGGYLVDHSSFTYVVGPQGKLRKILDHATSPEEIVAVVRSLL